MNILPIPFPAWVVFFACLFTWVNLRGIQMVTVANQQGGDVLYVIEPQSAKVIVLAYNPTTRDLRPAITFFKCIHCRGHVRHRGQIFRDFQALFIKEACGFVIVLTDHQFAQELQYAGNTHSFTESSR